MSLAEAVKEAKPGDLVWLLEGTYKGPLVLETNATREQPIVWRAAPGQRVTLEGQVVVKGSYHWVWGFEVTDPAAGEPLGPSGSLFAGAPGVHLINNIVHDTWHCGIGGWQNGPDHVYYGNIIWKVGQHRDAAQRCYPIYTQSDFAKHGWKFIVANLFLDTLPEVGGPGFNFHAYTQGGKLTGFHIENNVSRDGYFLIGGKGAADTGERVIGNYFYKSSPQLGYRRACQTEFRDNYIGRAGIMAKQFYALNSGPVSDVDAKPAPNVYTGNTVVLPDGGLHVMVLTTAHVDGKHTEATVRLDPADKFDGNNYSAPFNGLLRAQGKDTMAYDLATWRSGTEIAGNAFDAHSREIAGPPPNKIVLLPNDYEPGRGHLVVFNWDKSPAVEVDLSPVVERGAAFSVRKAKEPFGKPVAFGKQQGAASVPMNGQEMEVFLVLREQ